jgi:undecaprenyl diphosphate synthase
MLSVFKQPKQRIDRIPRHVAIIMDGNGRWAKARGLPRVAGHKSGAEALRKILEGCKDLGLEYLTIYAFSSENWNRPKSEISDLMELLSYYLQYEIETIHKNNIRLNIIGDRSRLSAAIQQQIVNAEALTENNAAFVLNVALSYGARQEILRAVHKMLDAVKNGALKKESITEDTVSSYLDTAALPDPDLLIRTGGEQRISNFLLWQSAYTEFYFTQVLWPDFTLDHMAEAFAEYAQRERRYGGTNG